MRHTPSTAAAAAAANGGSSPTAAAAAATDPWRAAPGGGGGGPHHRLVVKIADFGLARHKRSAYLSTRERDAGTAYYMAPGERGKRWQDGRDSGKGRGEVTDLWVFGYLIRWTEEGVFYSGTEMIVYCHNVIVVLMTHRVLLRPRPPMPSFLRGRRVHRWRRRGRGRGGGAHQREVRRVQVGAAP